MPGETVQAFIAVSPGGKRTPSTIRPTADEAWAALRASISDPDSLHDVGGAFTGCRLSPPALVFAVACLGAWLAGGEL